MVVSMNPHPRYQYKLEDLFQTDKTRSSNEADLVPPKGGPRRPWRIESSFSTLVRSLTLQAAQVKTFLSLTRRVRL